MRNWVQWRKNIRENLRIQVITPVFMLLLAGILGFVIMGIIDQRTLAATLIDSASTGGYSLELPERAVNINIQAWGGGGGGGGAICGQWGSGYGCAAGYVEAGGGGGGGYITTTLPKITTDPTAKPVVSGSIGGGGNAGMGSPGGSSTPSNGGAGGNSLVTVGNTTVTAIGGSGGIAAKGAGTAAGGAGGVTPGGTNGNDGFKGGSGGGDGGSSPNGGSGGSGGSRISGNGGSGNTPGGGGGGAVRGLTSGKQNGGSGGNGRVLVTYDVAPLPTLSTASINADFGPSFGGNTVTISGTDFKDGGVPGDVTITSITFGNNTASNINVINDSTITLTVPAYSMANPNIPTAVDVSITYTDKYGFIYTQTNSDFYTYHKGATTYTNECQNSSSGEWINLQEYLYTAQGSTVNCRIVLNGMFNGDISLRDDYWDMIDSSLSGSFASADSRFSSGSFGLTHANTYDPPTQTLLYTYTAPTAAVLNTYYDDGNGDDLFWPLIDTTVTGDNNLTQVGGDVVLGLLAEKYEILPEQTDDKYCVDCSSTFIISTYGAPYLGAITLSDNISNVGHSDGQSGVFMVEGSIGNTIDFSGLEGSDAKFSYIPKTNTISPDGYVRLLGSSAGPAISDSHIDIEVLETGLIITGPSNLKRGETGVYTLKVLLGDAWPSGVVDLYDLFSTGDLADGTFADITDAPGLTNTFDPVYNSYTFLGGPNETYIRAFTYTLRDDITTPPAFDSYLINITGSMSTPESIAWTSVNVLADRLMIKCAPAHPDCKTGYVNESKDYSITPNGALVGSAKISDNNNGILGNNGIANWLSSVPSTMSYTPITPGRKVLTATVTSSSSNSDMINKSFTSTSTDSLNDYIYVMANSMSMEGYEHLSHGQTGHYVLTMNGPFVGTVYLNDKLSDGSSAGGTFDDGDSCTFTLADYNSTSNTTACAFTYTPTSVSSDTVVTISASKDSNYNHTLDNASTDVTVYPPLSVTSISPSRGPSSGGTSITVTGKGFLVAEYGQIGSCDSANDPACTKVTLDIGGIPAICTNLIVVNSTTIRCTTTSHSHGLVSATVENKLNTRTYNTKSDAFTYVETTLEISPSQTSGGVNVDVSPISGNGFGVSNSIVSVGTNNPDGFVLSIEMYDPDNPTSPTSQRLNSINGDYISPTSGSWATPTTLGINEWGYAIDGIPKYSGNKFSAVPKFGPTTRQIIKTYGSSTTNLAGEVDSTTVTFGANVDYSLTPGDYTGCVLYTAVAIDPEP